MLNQTDLSRVDLNLLVLFETVLAQRHVGRAGEALNLSPSAISHGLGRLRRLLNDPLFLRTPKGVVPTARALELAAPIAAILAGVRAVVAGAEPFDPAQSTRRFIIGAPDAIAAVLTPPLRQRLVADAPGINLSLRQVLPPDEGRAGVPPWQHALAAIENGQLDIAIAPFGEVPARFAQRALFNERFVVGMRRGHPFAAAPTLDNYCTQQHLVVSQARDDHGFVDTALAKLGRSRRVALAVPNFLFALDLLAQSDLVAAVPRSLAATHAERFGLEWVEAPLPLREDTLYAVTSHAALADAGIAWLFGLIGEVGAR